MFRDSVRQFLDTDSKSVEALEAKFYYAGGSARYMFDMPTKDVITLIDLAVEKQLDLVLCGTPGRFEMLLTDGVVAEGPEERFEILSRFTLSRLADQFSPTELKSFAKHYYIRETESTASQLFEALLVQDVKHSNRLNIRSDGCVEREAVIGVRGVSEMHISELSAHGCPLHILIWPKYQPCIPGLFLLASEGSSAGSISLTFLIVTTASKRKVDPEALATLMRQLDAESAELIFVVPEGTHREFEIEEVEQPQAMKEYGWQTDVTSIKQRIKIFEF